MYLSTLLAWSSFRHLNHVFESNTVLPDGKHAGIKLLSSFTPMNTSVSASCAASNFFHQKFWIPSILGAVHPLLFATFFLTVSRDKLKSLTLVTFAFSCILTSSIHGMCGVFSLLSHIPPQNSINLSISGICPFRLLFSSNFLKKAPRCFWNMMLSSFLFLFSTYFSNVTVLYLNLSTHCSLTILKLQVAASLCIFSFNSFKIFSFFRVAFRLCFLWWISLLARAMFCLSSFISFSSLRSLRFPPSAILLRVLSISLCFTPWCDPVAFPITYTMSVSSGNVSALFRYILSILLAPSVIHRYVSLTFRSFLAVLILTLNSDTGFPHELWMSFLALDL